MFALRFTLQNLAIELVTGHAPNFVACSVLDWAAIHGALTVSTYFLTVFLNGRTLKEKSSFN